MAGQTFMETLLALQPAGQQNLMDHYWTANSNESLQWIYPPVLDSPKGCLYINVLPSQAQIMMLANGVGNINLKKLGQQMTPDNDFGK